MSKAERQWNEMERIELILNALKQGKKFDEIDAILYRVELEKRITKGQQSEIKVGEALRILPFVRAVHHVDPSSRADFKGIDFIVYLNEEDVDVSCRLNHVLVQVKSSPIGIEYFYQSLRRERHLSLQELDSYLKEHKLILINAKNPKNLIKENFSKRLNNIRNFHSKSLEF
ncbi:MAG: hypothetical protein V1808_01370 [Candidatus Daviesbacteria bacterium]